MSVVYIECYTTISDFIRRPHCSHFSPTSLFLQPVCPDIWSNFFHSNSFPRLLHFVSVLTFCVYLDALSIDTPFVKSVPFIHLVLGNPSLYELVKPLVVSSVSPMSRYSITFLSFFLSVTPLPQPPS